MNVKNEVFVWKGCILFDFRGLQDEMLFWRRLGSLLGRVLGGFWALLSGFQSFEDRSNFEAEVGTRKSGSRVARRASGHGSGGPNIGE